MNFIWLLFAHYIGDIALQTDMLAKNKSSRWYIMFAHCMIWTACICVGLQFLGLYTFWKVLFLLFGHWVCDKWKSSKLQTPETWHFIYYDQIWHIIQLLIVFLIR